MTVSMIFTEMASGATALATAFANIFSGLVPVFYTTGENGGLTIVSVLLIAAVVLSLGIWALEKVFGLFRFRKIGGGASRRKARG